MCKRMSMQMMVKKGGREGLSAHTTGADSRTIYILLPAFTYAPACIHRFKSRDYAKPSDSSSYVSALPQLPFEQSAKTPPSAARD